jgi:hypothetical protein
VSTRQATSAVRYYAARDELIRAVRYYERFLVDGEGCAPLDALAFAARDLVDAVNDAEPGRQPVGWARSSCDCCDAFMAPPPPDEEPRVRCCPDCVAKFEVHFTDEVPF